MAQLLIIEDDSASSELILRILGPEGHSLTFAENGAIGLAKLAHAKMDLVLTDLLMPIVEGLETIRSIRRVHPDVRIIAISGVRADYLDAASKFGADAVLRKPFHPAALRETVARVLAESPRTNATSRRRA
jgi:CheY-like chemotaxis protein